MAPSSKDHVNFEVIHKIHSIKKGSNAPQDFFLLIKDALQLEKGALLLYDKSRNFYFPWAYQGIDPTSIRRLRFSREELISFEEEAEVSLFSSNDLVSFKPHLSFREFSQLVRLAVIKFKYENTITGFLFIFNPEPSLTDLSFFFHGIISESSKLLYESRELFFTSLIQNQSMPDLSNDCVSVIQKYLTEARTKSDSFKIVAFSLAELITFISNQLPMLDKLQIKRDVDDILTAMSRGIGTLSPITADNFILLIEKTFTMDIKLIFHQLGITVLHFFNITSPVPSISFQTLTFPEDGTSVKDLMEKIDVLF